MVFEVGKTYYTDGRGKVYNWVVICNDKVGDYPIVVYDKDRQDIITMCNYKGYSNMYGQLKPIKEKKKYIINFYIDACGNPNSFITTNTLKLTEMNGYPVQTFEVEG